MSRALRTARVTNPAALAVILAVVFAGVFAGVLGLEPGVSLAAPPGSTSAVTYGLGDAPGAFAHCVDADLPCCANPASVCLPGTVAGYYHSSAFTALTGPASVHRISEIRLFVAYDAVQEFNGSITDPGCRFSRVLSQSWYDGAGRLHSPGQSLNDLVAGLIEARLDGLTPIVSIAGYASPNARPSWDQPAPDPTTTAGYWEYRCGVQGILDAVSRLPVGVVPHIWEALNEPDGFRVYNGAGDAGASACEVSAAGGVGVDGAAKAACDYRIAAGEIRGFAGHANDTVIAGVFSHPSHGYLAQYARALAATIAPGQYPATWSVHDYGDVTGSFTDPVISGLRSFDQALAADTGGAARDLWVTEAGTELTDPEPFSGCGQVAGAPDTLGGCMVGQPARQALAAQSFFALPLAGSAVPITHLFWYQWEGDSTWDSGILDGAGDPRAPWCAFYGGGSCDGSPNPA
jgi:hypothetical protein